MTREEIYNSCLASFGKSKSLLMELATGTGKTRMSILLVNHLCDTVYKGKKTKMLLLVAKTVHKQTWRDEFRKWGGIKVDDVVIECYESLKKHTEETFDFIVLDEVHHIKSDIRLDLLACVNFTYMLGLSATIPRNLKRYFQYKYHSQIVSCDIVEAIEDDILPEPEILLFPLELDNKWYTETIEINARTPGPVHKGSYEDLWKFKKAKVHAIVTCTQRQKLRDLDSLITWEKNKVTSGNRAMEQTWLYHCGKRLEFLSNCKVKTVQEILKHLDKFRTITFCKTIHQSEVLGKNCIHSQNRLSTEIYDMFNAKRIDHITAVNILNENANLVDCKYAIFANLTSSEVMQVQRCGRAMRHKHPVIIVPYYKGTREQEIVEKMFENYKKEYIRVINSINEI